MVGFHPPKHNNIVFRYNAFLCEKRLALQALEFGNRGGKIKGGQICCILMTRLTQKREYMIQFYG